MDYIENTNKIVLCRSLFKYTGNILELGRHYSVYKETNTTYFLLDDSGKKLSRSYMKWRFNDIDIDNDLMSSKVAIPEFYGMFYFHDLQFYKGFSLKAKGKTSLIPLIESSNIEDVQEHSIYGNLQDSIEFNLPLMTETIVFLDKKTMSERLNFLIKKDILIKENNFITLTPVAANKLVQVFNNKLLSKKFWDESNIKVILNIIKAQVFNGIYLDELFKLEKKQINFYATNKKNILTEGNFYLGEDGDSLLPFIFFKESLSTNYERSYKNLLEEVKNELKKTLSISYKQSNNFMVEDDVILNKQIHNFTFGKKYKVFNCKKIRNSLEIIKLQTDNYTSTGEKIFKYVDKKYLKRIVNKKEDIVYDYQNFKIHNSNIHTTFIHLIIHIMCILFIDKYVGNPQYKKQVNNNMNSESKDFITDVLIVFLIKSLDKFNTGNILFDTVRWHKYLKNNIIKHSLKEGINSKEIKKLIKYNNGGIAMNQFNLDTTEEEF